jgi:hypothetical protein
MQAFKISSYSLYLRIRITSHHFIFFFFFFAIGKQESGEESFWISEDVTEICE